MRRSLDKIQMKEEMHTPKKRVEGPGESEGHFDNKS